MGVITDKDLEKIWEENGLKFRIHRFHKFLAERGLLEYSVPSYLFEDHVLNDILRKFFVKGVREQADGRQEYEPDERCEAEDEAGPSGPETARVADGPAAADESHRA
jgi:hypothetical protein